MEIKEFVFKLKILLMKTNQKRKSLKLEFLYLNERHKHLILCHVFLIDYEPLCAVFSYIGVLRKIYKFGTSSTDNVKPNDFNYPQHTQENRNKLSLHQINQLNLIKDACYQNKFAQKISFHNYYFYKIDSKHIVYFEPNISQTDILVSVVF